MMQYYKILLLLSILCASSTNLKSIEETSTEQLRTDKEKQIHAKIENNKELLAQRKQQYQEKINSDTVTNTEKKKDTV
jgi:hypothetical protein